MSCWELPEKAVISGKTYQINADFRDVLEIFSYFDDPDLPDFIKWQIAVALFFQEKVEDAHMQEAMKYLSEFLKGGAVAEEKPAPRLLDWEQDGSIIVADINKVAGREIRALPFVHWWTFLAWFHGIGEGQLYNLVSIRQKLQRGKPLDSWEKEYYREHKDAVDLKKRYSLKEREERAALEKLLSSKEEM